MMVKTLEDAVRDALDGKSSRCICPAHDDNAPSLSVSPGTTQPVVLHCHAGCETAAIIEAGGLDWAEIMVPAEEDVTDQDRWTPAGPASHVWRYRDERGMLLFEVLRVDVEGGKKRIFQRRPDPTAKHGHAWNMDGVERVLYKLPEVRAAVREGYTIHITEGEKCADALQKHLPAGDVATTNPQGAGKWAEQFGEMVSGANVVIYADADEAGRAHARLVRENCLANGCTVRVLEPPPGVLRSGKSINDVADHIEAGRSLVVGMDNGLLETTPESQEERARTGIDILDLVRRPRGMVDYVIPGTMAKGERLILIGFEGTGKSTLCRQIAVMVAAGIHPWTQQEIEPRRVLFVDAENHPDQVLEDWSLLVGLADRHGHALDRGMLTVMEEWESDHYLDTVEGAAWLEERIHAYKPELTVMGPLTNLAGRDLRDDEPVRRLRNAVNRARLTCNSAFLMEHHAPHKGPMDKQREPRPYGSSLFLKWPDYGYGMRPTETDGVYEWYKNRGPRVRSRRWPGWIRDTSAALEGRQGDEWPWMECVLDDNGNVVG